MPPPREGRPDSPPGTVEKLRAPRAREKRVPPRLSPVLRHATLLLAALSIAGLLLTGGANLGPRPLVSLLLIASSLLVALAPSRVPALRIDVNSTHPLVLCLLAVAGPIAAAGADAAGVVMASFGRRRRALLSHVVFNLSAVIVSVAVSWVAFVVAGGRAGATIATNAAALLAAGSAYYLVNLILIALALGGEFNQSPIDALRETCAWTALPYLTGIPAAVAILWLMEGSTWLALAFGVAASFSLGPLLRAQAWLLGHPARRPGATDT